MRKVIGIGETVLDIIFKDDEPVSAVPGGSVFNALISLGRAGVKASLISETGNDHIGRLADCVPTDCPQWKQWFRKWFIGMVAQWLGRDRRCRIYFL